MYKGIILAGGRGSRLFPITLSTSKQLLPIYDKPMVYYPLSVLMTAGIREILIIVNSNDLENYKNLLSDGSQLGLNISYKIQPSPDGLAQSFILGEKFIGSSNVCLILGDNIFFGENFSTHLERGTEREEGATIFSYHVNNPEDFGVIEFDGNRIINIEEKPKNPKSNLAIPGLYFFDKNVVRYCKHLIKSNRNELEIVDLLKIYVKNKLANFKEIRRGISWLDMGSFDDLNDCSNYIRAIEKRQNFMISSLEEIAYLNKWITKKKLIKISSKYNNEYGNYLKKLCL